MFVHNLSIQIAPKYFYDTNIGRFQKINKNYTYNKGIFDYICQICFQNVYTIKKIKLDCGHNLCVHCNNRLLNINDRDFTCPFCRNMIRRRIQYNDRYDINNNHQMYFNHIAYRAIYFDFKEGI